MLLIRNESPLKGINTAEKIFEFNKERKCKKFEILTPKHMLQRLQTTFSKLKAVNTTENLLNETHCIIHSM